MTRFLAVALILGATAAGAQPGVPGPDWFTGLYEMVGRGAGSNPIDARVRIEPYGLGLLVRGCAGADLVLSFDPYGVRQNALIAGEGDLGCLFHVDGKGHPMLTCQSEDGTRFTLWPLEPDFRSAPLVCG